MKIILLASLLLLAHNTSAQQMDIIQFKSFNELIKENKVDHRKFSFNFPSNNIRIKSLPKVILLPLDNMPCLVPDVKNFNMPVLMLSPSGTMLVK